ncbi:BglII/BstYI family type II restriction endonuclease, partial [Pseudomonas viridiflava]
MRISEHYSHLNGLEFLMVHKPNLWEEIKEVISNVDASLYQTKESKEKTKLGKMLYSPKEINQSIKEGFERHNWQESRTSYWVTSDAKLVRKTMHLDNAEQKKEIISGGGRPFASSNQTDFVKDRVA